MRRILPIDDDSKTLMVVGAFLRQRSYEVLVAPDGARGLALAKANAPDLVVCDLDMPGISGFEVLTLIRREPGLSETPVIFLTAHSSRPYQRQGMNLGADDFLAKPVDLEELTAAIEARLRRHDEEQERTRQRINQAMQTFAGIVHDLRDPLFVICGYTQQLGMGAPALPGSNASPQDMLARLQLAANRMQRIVGEVMHLARSRLQNLAFDPGALDLRSFLQQVLKEHEQADRLRLNSQSGNYQLVADVVRVRQIVENLLSNALKYSTQPVKIRLAAREDACVLEVEDSGIGIPPEEQAGLGEPFFRASNAGDRPGCGLGLSVVRSCVELHGGKLTCTSLPGSGTKFVVVLPKSVPRTPPADLPQPAVGRAGFAAPSPALPAAACPPPIARSGSENAPPTPKRSRALVVDDDPLVRTLMRSLLEETQLVSVTGEAGTVSEARLLLGRQIPDLVFLDVSLPDGLGFDLLAALKPATKVIFVSGAEEHAVHAFDCDAVDYLLKPVTRERLAHALQRAQTPSPPPPAPPAPGTGPARTPQTFLIKTLRGSQLIGAQEIKTIIAYGEYCWVHWGKQEKTMLRKSLKQWQDDLPAGQFARVHRNAIVNLRHLLRVEHLANGSLEVHLRDTAEPIPVSQRLRGDFNRKLKAFAGQTR
jgi:signal transduction histidine kinase